jgi:5-methylcytosine-specific restriction endonuclease McrA
MSGHSRKSGHHRTKATSGSRMKLQTAAPVESAVRAQNESEGTPLYAPVLVLNASYEPINICAARRALVLVLKGVAMTEEENGHYLHAQRIAMRLPSVIRLLEYRRIPHQTRALSRKNILLRDRNTCQYCATVLASGELTLDHVVPRSRGGLSTWENLVACCHSCNRMKGNQLLVETSMKLLREPRAFNLHTSRHIMRMIGRSDSKWRKYLFY